MDNEKKKFNFKILSNEKKILRDNYCSAFMPQNIVQMDDQFFAITKNNHILLYDDFKQSI